MRRSILLTICAAGAIAMGACSDPGKESKDGLPTPLASPTASPSASPAESPTTSPSGDDDGKKAEDLAGRWQGPEGTYINITKNTAAEDKDGDKYTVEIADLDGPKSYEGTAKGDVIEFTRAGKTETVRSATGTETGMKYLLEEKNCVVVTKGKEGFCRKG